jgi:CRISPR/Cas system CMR-associated protein Cmr5 small subunit
MKKLLAILILMSMILAFTVSCRSSDKNNKDEKKQFLDNDSEKRVFSTVDGFGDDVAGSCTGLVSNASLGVHTTSEYKKFEELKGTTKTFPGVDGIFVYYESRCLLKGEKSGEYGSFYSIYDTYKNQDNPKEEFEVLRGSNIITGYLKNDYQSGAFKEISEDDLKGAANDILLKMIGREKLSEFVYSKIENVANLLHAVIYEKYIEGYVTDEAIMVLFSGPGEFVAFKCENSGKYDSLSKSITKKALDEAHSALKEKIVSIKDLGTVTKTYAPCIITSTDGKVFMEMKVGYKHPDGYDYAHIFVTNVI